MHVKHSSSSRLPTTLFSWMALSLPVIGFLSSYVPAEVTPASSTPAQQPDSTPTDPRIDSTTGRQLATWPHNRPFNHLMMVLELDIPTMSEAKLTGIKTLTLVAVGQSRLTIPLDSNGPNITRVELENGTPCTFTLEDRKLLINLPTPAKPGVAFSIRIHYTLDYSANKGEGLTYSKAIPDGKGKTYRNPQIHAQGQATLNSKWFPCHDFPNEKLATRMIITVDESFDVVSNGYLAATKPASPGSDGKARKRWDWVQDTPHSPYLVTLAIAQFSIIQLGGDDSARPSLDMPLYIPEGTESQAKEIFKDTAEMVVFFERIFDYPYPWDQYAQCVVRDFVAGGMENTSCTLLHSGAATGEPGSQDDLISHELAHQWFGDLVTCKTWADLWLNEGWASFSEALWNEHKAGKESPEAGRRAYQRTIRGFFQSQRFRNKSSWPQYTPMVSNRYDNADTLFSRPEDPYAKGAMLLHMLRARLGDNAFFSGARSYLKKYAYKVAETSDFRREMEAASGQSLERFFDQWALRPGLPRLDAELSWDEQSSQLEVSILQTQHIDGYNPAYAFTIPIRLKFEDQSTKFVYMDIDSITSNATFKLDAKPTQVTLDPGMTIIAPTQMKKELSWWMNELSDPPSEFAQIQALHALEDHLALTLDPIEAQLVRNCLQTRHATHIPTPPASPVQMN